MKNLPDKRRFFPPLSNWFDDFFGENDSLFADWNRMLTTPAVNVVEHDEHFRIEVAVPGMKKEDFKVSVEENTLVLMAETKREVEEDEDNFKRREFNFTSFKRTFWLPENVNTEDIKAEYKDGVLTVTLKKLPEFKAKEHRTIAVH